MPYLKAKTRRRKRRKSWPSAQQLSLGWMSGPFHRTESQYPDSWVMVVTYVLALTGLIMVFSASGVMAEAQYGDSMFFLKRQALALIIGLAVMHLVAQLHYQIWKRFVPHMMVATVVLLVLVLIPSLGWEVKGARRWFRIGEFSIQPAEIAKIVVVLYLASFLAKTEDRVRHWSTGFLPPLLLVGLVAMLIFAQPDMGTAVVLGILVVGLLFLGGARLSHLAGLLLVLIPLMVQLAMSSEYRRKRMLSFLDPWQDPTDSGFQLSQSFVAFGSGGMFGLGLGDSKQKLFFLPEVHADFVLALIGEELGFLGTAFLMVLFALLVMKGFQIAGQSPDAFGQYLALGVTLLIGSQALINAGVVAGLMPTKGLTLPLISYGGSSLVVTCFAIGILLSVSRQGNPRGIPST